MEIRIDDQLRRELRLNRNNLGMRRLRGQGESDRGEYFSVMNRKRREREGKGEGGEGVK